MDGLVKTESVSPVLADQIHLVLSEINPSARVNAVQISHALSLISNGSTERAAAIDAGIAYSTFNRWKQESATLYRLINTCKEICKGRVMEVFAASATKVRTKKTVTVRKEQRVVDGEVVELETTETKEQEVLPGSKDAKSWLETMYPEEFGRIDRLKAMKINSEASVGQIEDAGDIESLDADQLTDVIDLMLDKGRFTVDNSRSIEDEYESQLVKVESKETDEADSSLKDLLDELS